MIIIGVDTGGTFTDFLYKDGDKWGVLKRLSTPGNPAQATFYDFEIYMGLCEHDMLSSSFEGNYIPGTKVLAFSSDTLTISLNPGEWYDFDLEIPYWYDGQDNLILDFMWSGGYTSDECLYTWHWDTGTIRSISGSYSGSTGTMSSMMVMVNFIGELALEQATFAGIKSGLQGEGN